MNLKFHAGCFTGFPERAVPGKRFLGSRFIQLVRFGKMGKQPLHPDTRKLTDSAVILHALFGIRKSNPAHTGIYFNMNTHFFLLSNRFRRQFLRHIQAKYCGADIQAALAPHNPPEIRTPESGLGF